MCQSGRGTYQGNALTDGLDISRDLFKPIRHKLSEKSSTAKCWTAAHPVRLQEQDVEHHVHQAQLPQHWVAVLWIGGVDLRGVHFAVCGKSLPCTKHHIFEIPEGLKLFPAGGKLYIERLDDDACEVAQGMWLHLTP